MRNKLRLKKITKKNNTGSIILIITLAFITTFFLISLFSKSASNIFLSFAQMRVEQLCNQVIHNAISREVIDELDIEALFYVVKNNDGQIVSLDFNPIVVNRVLNKASYAIYRNLKALERGELHLIDDYQNIFFGYDIEKLKRGVVYEIPMGVMTKTPLLANLGPKIPVKFSLIGSLNAYVDTRIRNYGINNIMMEVLIHIDISNQLILPMMSKRMLYELNIPVATKLIYGEIPKYYQSGITGSSPILSLPME